MADLFERYDQFLASSRCQETVEDGCVREHILNHCTVARVEYWTWLVNQVTGNNLISLWYELAICILHLRQIYGGEVQTYTSNCRWKETVRNPDELRGEQRRDFLYLNNMCLSNLAYIENACYRVTSVLDHVQTKIAMERRSENLPPFPALRYAEIQRSYPDDFKFDLEEVLGDGLLCAQYPTMLAYDRRFPRLFLSSEFCI